MKKIYFLSTAFLSCTLCKAQNLVPNPGFETFTSCPTMHGQLDLAVPWAMPSNTSIASSDLYNSCNTISFGVPSNASGYQLAHSGAGYAGIYTFGYFDCREYLQVQLTAPLTAGVVYKAEMYVSPSENAGIAVDAIGIYISTGAVSGTGSYLPLPFIPQVSNPANSIITDTLVWTLVSGLYTASGGENYITIGNFLYDMNSDTLTFNPSGWLRGYYRIDDVSLSIATPVNELNGPGEINIYPVPFSDVLNLTADNTDLSEIMLYDIASRKLLQQKFTNTVTLNTAQLAKGIYIYEVRNRNGVVKNGKLIKE